MNALALLSETYNTDDEDTEMSDSDIHSTPKKNEKEKLPLPESISNLTICGAAHNTVTDDPSKHNGRIRSFPHERGNWATCVFIPYKHDNMLPIFCDNLLELCKTVSDFYVCDDLHISLSRTVILQHHWIDLFVEDVKKRLKNVESFYLDFDNLAVYSNDEKTRTFIGLKVRFGYCQLMECVNCVNAAMQEFKLPTFYEDPSFHMSLMWCVGYKMEELEEMLHKLKVQFDRFKISHSIAPSKINRIYCKIGNRTYKFPLI